MVLRKYLGNRWRTMNRTSKITFCMTSSLLVGTLVGIFIDAAWYAWAFCSYCVVICVIAGTAVVRNHLAVRRDAKQLEHMLLAYSARASRIDIDALPPDLQEDIKIGEAMYHLDRRETD